MNADLIKEVGLPIALVIVAGWFGIKHLWPFLRHQLDVAQEQTREANKQVDNAHNMIAGLKETLVQHTELSRQMVGLLKEIKAENGGRNKHN